MSKPATHSRTAAPSQTAGRISSGEATTAVPRKAIQAAMGASINAAPSQKWASQVNRLA